MQRYVLERAAPAVIVRRGTRTVHIAPAASVVRVIRPLDKLNGLVEVTIDGQPALMFAQDIRLRGRRVDYEVH